MQHRIVGFALDLIESATLPRTTVQAPFDWSEDESWKERYAKVDEAEAERLRSLGEARRERQERSKQASQTGGD
jgi:hypothetical protein